MTLREQLKTLEQEIEAEEQNLWGPVPEVDTLANSRAYQEISRILHESPILVTPALNWLRQKKAEIADATLRTLYSDADLAVMRDAIRDRE